jgi:hypothetical protein
MLAEETGSTAFSWDGRQVLFDSSGKIIPENKSSELTENMWQMISDAMVYSSNSGKDITKATSLKDYLMEKIKTFYLDDSTNTAEFDRQHLLYVCETWGAFVGSPIEQQSLKFFWMEECIEGEHLFLADTYQKILDYIAAPALRDATIVFDANVTKVTSNTYSSGVGVETKQGQSFQFDQIVMTNPLGWLKRNQQAFDPPLPNRLASAIGAITYGNLDKVLLGPLLLSRVTYFSRSFLLSNLPGGQSLRLAQWNQQTYQTLTIPLILRQPELRYIKVVV